MAMNGSFFTLRLEELVVSQAVVVVVAAVGGEKDLKSLPADKENQPNAGNQRLG